MEQFKDFGHPGRHWSRGALANLNDLKSVVEDLSRAGTGISPGEQMPEAEPEFINPIVRITGVTDPESGKLYRYSYQVLAVQSAQSNLSPLWADLALFFGGPDEQSPAYERSNNARVPVDGSAIVELLPGPPGPYKSFIFIWDYEFFYARLGSATGFKYAWTQVYPTQGGTFATVPGGFTGTPTLHFAAEINENPNVAPGTIVQVHRGYCSGYPTVRTEITVLGSGFTYQKQSVAIINAAAGTFTLTFDNTLAGTNPQTTAAIPFDVNAAGLKAKLEALSNIVSVTVTGSGTEASPFIVTFTDLHRNYLVMVPHSSLDGDQEWLFEYCCGAPERSSDSSSGSSPESSDSSADSSGESSDTSSGTSSLTSSDTSSGTSSGGSSLSSSSSPDVPQWYCIEFCDGQVSECCPGVCIGDTLTATFSSYVHCECIDGATCTLTWDGTMWTGELVSDCQEGSVTIFLYCLDGVWYLNDFAATSQDCGPPLALEFLFPFSDVYCGEADATVRIVIS